MRTERGKEPTATRLNRRIYGCRWLKSAIPLVATSMFLMAQSATAQGVSGEEPRLPPVDIYVYADQSRTVFNDVSGNRPVDRLTEMIGSALDSRLQDGRTRTVLSDGGTFSLIGFGDSNIANEQANDCSDDIRVLADNLSAGDRTAINNALANYAANDPDHKATNFNCVYQHIAANAAIQQAANADRQAVILIASDFVHDPFNRSFIDAEAGAESFYIQGQGLCQIAGSLVDGNLPPAMGDMLDAAAGAKGNAVKFRPIFVQLELTLPPESFDNNQYDGCARRVNGAGLFASLTADRLSAFRFRFEDAGSFGTEFANVLFTRIAPPMVIRKNSLVPLGDDSMRLVLEVINQGRVEALVHEVNVSVGDDRIGSYPISLAVPAGGRSVTETISIGTRLAAEQALAVVASYRLGNASTALQTNRLTLAEDRDRPLDITIEENAIISPPGQPARVPIRLQNHLLETVTVQSINAGRSGAVPTSQDVDILPLSIGAGEAANVEMRISASDVRRALREGALEITVSAATADNEFFQIGPDPVPQARAPSAPIVISANILLNDRESRSAVLRLEVRNPNNFDLPLSGVSFLVDGTATPLAVQPDRINTPLTPGETRPLTINAPADSDTINQLIGLLQRHDGQLVVSAGRLQSEPVRPLHEYAANGRPPVLCPDRSLPSSYEWTVGEDRGARLHLELVSHASLPPAPVERFVVERVVVSPPAPAAWKRLPPGGFGLSLVLPFDTPQLQRLKHQATDIQIRLEDANGSVCGQPITLPAHDDGNPKPIQVVDDSWSLRPVGNRQMLALRIFHDSSSSLQRLERVTLVRAGQSAEAGDPVELHILPTTIDPRRSYTNPGQDNAVEILLDYELNGFSLGDVHGSSIRLFPERRQSALPSAIPVRLEKPRIAIAFGEWSEDESRLLLGLAPQGKRLKLDRVLLATSRNPRAPDIFTATLDTEEILLPQQAGSIQATITRQQFDENQQVFSDGELFACVPAIPDRPADCAPWEPLPAMPRSTFDVSAVGPGYDDRSAELSFRLENVGHYPDVFIGAELQAARKEGRPRFQDAQTPVYLAPDDALDVRLPVDSSGGRSFLLDSVLFSVAPSFLRESPVVTPLRDLSADLPTVTIHDISVDYVDVIAAWTMQQFDLDVDPPVVRATITVRRQEGPLRDLGLQVAMVREGTDNAFQSLTADVALPAAEALASGRQVSREIAIETATPALDQGAAIQAGLTLQSGALVVENVHKTINYNGWPRFSSALLYLSLLTSLGLMVLIILTRARRNRVHTATPTDTTRKWSIWAIGILLIVNVSFIVVRLYFTDHWIATVAGIFIDRLAPFTAVLNLSVIVIGTYQRARWFRRLATMVPVLSPDLHETQVVQQRMFRLSLVILIAICTAAFLLFLEFSVFSTDGPCRELGADILIPEENCR